MNCATLRECFCEKWSFAAPKYIQKHYKNSGSIKPDESISESAYASENYASENSPGSVSEDFRYLLCVNPL